MEQLLNNSTNTVQESRIERRGNVVNIYKKEGVYTIIYGQHTREMNPDLIPKGVDGLVLETGSDLAWPVDPIGTLDGFITNTQYRSLNKRIRGDKIPIFFADTYLKSNFIEDVKETDLFLMALETGIGALMVRDIFNKIIYENKISRRELLKMGLKGGFATWLGLPLGSISLRGVSDYLKSGENLSAEVLKFSERLHPEVRTLSMKIRNVVIAEKEEWIARQLGIGSRLATIVGSSHVGIEDQLMQASEQRLDFLKTLKPVLNKIYDEKTFYSIGRFDYDGVAWRASNLSEVPALKEIVT